MTAKTRHSLVCLAALAFLSSATARAEEETGVPWEEQELTGRVVDVEGRPIAGVEIWRPTDSAERRPAAVSGPDGLFVVPAGGMYPLSACPPGWLPDESPSRAPRDPAVFEIRLRPAARIAGRVVDGQGEPVEGVQVEARLAGMSIGCVVYSPSGCPGPTYLRTGYTDADGRFVFESLEPGWFEVRASDSLPKVVRRLGEAGASAQEIEFVGSEKLVPLEGRVVDADGEPVEGARVSVSGARPRTEARTDADGVYRFSRVFPGSHRFEARHPDLGRIEERIQVAGPRARFDVRMPPATIVQGRILGRDGSPVAGPLLSVDDEAVELDAEGRFRFSLSPGEHVVKAEAPHRSPAEWRVTATGDPIDLDLELSHPATITGRIAGLTRRQWISLELKDGPQESSAREIVDDQDRFQILDVPPGTWTLVATDNNGRTLERRIQVEEGQEIVEDFHFPALPAVRGRVLDPEGRPVLDASLAFQQGELVRVWAGTDAEGRFTAHLADGTWTVKAEQKGFGSAAAAVTVAGAPVELPDFRLVRSVAVSGTLSGLAPGEVPFVLATSEDGVWTRGAHAKQDASFLIPDLWPGTWILTAELDERQSSTRVRILPQDTEMRVDLVFEVDEAPEGETGEEREPAEAPSPSRR